MRVMVNEHLTINVDLEAQRVVTSNGNSLTEQGIEDVRAALHTAEQRVYALKAALMLARRDRA